MILETLCAGYSFLCNGICNWKIWNWLPLMLMISVHLAFSVLSWPLCHAGITNPWMRFDLALYLLWLNWRFLPACQECPIQSHTLRWDLALSTKHLAAETYWDTDLLHSHNNNFIPFHTAALMLTAVSLILNGGNCSNSFDWLRSLHADHSFSGNMSQNVTSAPRI